MYEFWNWLEKFIKPVEKFINTKPFWWTGLLISTFLMFISLILNRHFYDILPLFVVSFIGTGWRESERDISSAILNTGVNFEFKRRLVYRLGNLIIIGGLLIYYLVRG